jgi:hypothetical protein
MGRERQFATFDCGRLQANGVPVAGGLESPLPMETAVEGSFSPDGKRIAYQHVERWQRQWRNYRGGQAQPIWILDLKLWTVGDDDFCNAAFFEKKFYFALEFEGSALACRAE